MLKSELIDSIAVRFPDLGQTDAKQGVEAILDAMTETLAQGDRIEIRGFGSFGIRYREPRIGRNPKTGQLVQVPRVAAPFFKTGKDMRDGVNSQAGDNAPA